MRDLLANAPDDVVQLLEDWPIVLEMVPPPDSIILVAGAYCGKLIDLITRLQPHYGHVYGFEPQLWARERAIERLRERRPHNALVTAAILPNVVVYPWGLGIEDGTFPMGEAGTDAASFIKTGPGSREQGTGQLFEASQLLTNLLQGERIGLFVLNVEGYEFELLPLLRRTGWLERIDRLAVQWHLGLGDGPRYSGSGEYWPSRESPERRPLNRNAMNDEINYLQADGFHKVYDRRPAWTYHEHAALSSSERTK